MEKKEKQTYEAPALTVVTFKTERGYALSSLAFWRTDEDGDDQMEDYTTGNGWNSGSNTFWD